MDSRSIRFGFAIAAAAAGAAAFASAQAVLMLLARQAGSPADAGWFLNSGRAVAVIAVVLALTAIVPAAAGRVPPWLSWWAFTAGAVVPMTITLFVIGPGTIFPIVLGIGTVVIGAAALVGTGVGAAYRALRAASRRGAS